MIRQIQTVDLDIRSDPAGDGWFHSPRGDRLHNGIDYVCQVNQPILSPVNGVVTKHGYPYGDDLSWRYIEITDGDANKHRLFYIQPTMPIGHTVTTESIVGNAQNIVIRYPDQGMLAHVHYEIMNQFDEYLDPGDV